MSHLIANLPPGTEGAPDHSDNELLAELRGRSVAHRCGETTARNAAVSMAEIWQRQNQELAK